ncbi:carbohydrate-binding module family 21 protein [Calocera viscosa TUFC12733]|uniref:Carbohydrate-binding module family 21 protein n=1 Tax=Calocera viscosa (strain TUFC12733) TaxID=1330018 RepID=A0A167KZS8_CALVF|nr:carbohydrate-binding module family 21 protein [Calocera viscosa TUFC12733]
MPLLTSLPTLFPFSLRFFLPQLYPAPPKPGQSEKGPSPFAPKFSSFAAHALTSHAQQHLAGSGVAHGPGLLREKSQTPPPTPTPTLTVPVRAHVRHTRSADPVFHPAPASHAVPAPARAPLRTITNTNSMPYALPSPSPTVVLSVPQPPNDLHLPKSFVFPLRTIDPQRTIHPSAMATDNNSAKKDRPASLVLTENKENGGPSRAIGPMPLIPRTGSAQRLRQLGSGVQNSPRSSLSTTPAPVPAPQPEPSTSTAADSSGSSTATPSRRSATPSVRQARKPPMNVNIPRELTASPQQPSPPPSSPVSSRAPVNLRLDLHALKRTLSEAQVVTRHHHPVQIHHQVHPSRPLHQSTSSGSLIVPTPSALPVTPPLGERPPSRSEIMLRKKSGELVRPAIRTPGSLPRKITKSEPTTPTGPKFVHFDSQLEHVKLFLAEQKPAAVSRDGSPTETSEGELSSTNEYPFPLAYASSDDEKIRRALQIRVLNMPPLLLQNVEGDVRLETITLSDDARALNGTIVVRNLAFQKWVVVRFTLDDWQTRSEVSGRHNESLPGGGFDRFAFSIRLVDVLPRIEAKTMQLAVRFSIEGREMWDNNRGENYKVEFSKRKLLAAAPAGQGHKASKSLPANGPSSASAEGKRNEWPVKSAVTDQMADLRRELEKVVAEEMSPPTVVKRSVTVTYQPDRSSPKTAPAGGPRKEVGFGDSPLPLGKRYNFGDSLNSDWSGRPAPAQQSTIPFPSGSLSGYSSTGKTSVLRGKKTHSRDGSGASSPGTVPFPSMRNSPAHIPDFATPISGDLPRMPPRGSPRDAPYGAFDGSPTPPELRPDGLPSARRNHQRSYFDTWPGFGTASIRKTPPGTPGRFNSYPPLSPSLDSLPRVPEVIVPSVPVVPWANLVPLPPSPHDDSTASSTPSIVTEGSSMSQSPSSPPSGTILPAMVLSETDSVPNSYSYFLDRFCFYTGPGEVASTAESTPRRTMSASDIPSSYPSPNLDRFVSAFSPPFLDVPTPSKAYMMIPSPPSLPSPETETPSTA